MPKPPIAALKPFLPPPPDLARLSDGELARCLWAMAWRWRDGSSDHTWRLLDEAAKRMEKRNER